MTINYILRMGPNNYHVLCGRGVSIWEIPTTHIRETKNKYFLLTPLTNIDGMGEGLLMRMGVPMSYIWETKPKHFFLTKDHRPS